jgi:hypothetical protein
MEIINKQKRNYEIQSLIREFGNTLIVESAIFLKNPEDNEDNKKRIEKIINRFEERLKNA